MRAFLHAHQQIRGASKALRAIDLAIDHLGSPYETILYLFSLPAPQAREATASPSPFADQPIAPESREAHLVAQHNFYPDLFWPDKQLIVEYDSFKHHSTPKKTEHDARRT